MADKEKKVAQKSDVEKATTEESKAAAKVAKAAKGNANKKDKPNFFVRSKDGSKRFFKDFKGECKKIVWPDAKTVLKSTGIVLLVVAIVGLIVYGIDQGLSAGIGGLKKLATGEETTVSETTEGEHDHDHESEEETAESKEETTEAETEAEAETTAAEETTEAEETEAEETTEAEKETEAEETTEAEEEATEAEEASTSEQAE